LRKGSIAYSVSCYESGVCRRLHHWLAEAIPALTTRGIVLAEYRRSWDSAIGPHSTAGFFKVKQQMPRILDELELQ